MRGHRHVVIFALFVCARPVAADTSATCERLHAEARSEAVVLYGPNVQLDGAHVPTVTNVIDPTAVAANGLQARLSLAVSPSDMLKGRAIERVADAECARVDQGDTLERVLAIGSRVGELASARAELAFLEAHVGELDGLVSDASERLDHQRGTVIELDELRSQRRSIQLRAAERREAIAVLEEVEDKGPPPDLARVVTSYRESALEVDRRHASVRDLAAWHVDVRGGVAGSDRADWFAVVEVGYSLGGLFQGSADREAIAARRAELAHDVRDVSVRVEQLRATMKRSVDALELELRTLDSELEHVRGDHERATTLADTNDSARAMRDRYSIELIELEARRVAASALLDARRAFVGDKS